MGKRLIFVLTLVLAVAMVGAALTYAGGHGFRNGGLRAGRGDRPFANLTEEQRAEIQALVETKKEAGATREQIREAVGAKLQEWGIELPQKRGLRHGCVLRHGFFRGPYPAEESAAEPEETAPEEISAKLSTTTAVQSASWGEIKSQFK